MNPYNEWTHREIKCKLFMLEDIQLIGYAKFGDEWIQLIEVDAETEVMEAIDKVESEVDRKLREIQTMDQGAQNGLDTEHIHWPMNNDEPNNDTTINGNHYTTLRESTRDDSCSMYGD